MHIIRGVQFVQQIEVHVHLDVHAVLITIVVATIIIIMP